MTGRSLASAGILTVLATVLGTLGAIAAGDAHADVYLLTTLEGEDSTALPRGAPDHVSFKVINPTRTRARVALDALVLLGPDGNTRLAVTDVRANNRPARSGAVNVPGHATVHIMIFFTGVPPARANEDRFVVRLAARVDGEPQRADSTITRPRRGRAD